MSIQTTHLPIESFEKAFENNFGECEFKDKLIDCLSDKVDEEMQISVKKLGILVGLYQMIPQR